MVPYSSNALQQRARRGPRNLDSSIPIENRKTMEKSKAEPSAEARSIHLVPRRPLQLALADIVAADSSQLLPPELHQQRSRQNTGFQNSEHHSGGDYSKDSVGRAPLSRLNPATVLRELFELLEDYSPIWYTEENHDRAVAALRGTIW
jgi:hypothetical protein